MAGGRLVVEVREWCLMYNQCLELKSTGFGVRLFKLQLQLPAGQPWPQGPAPLSLASSSTERGH